RRRELPVLARSRHRSLAAAEQLGRGARAAEATRPKRAWGSVVGGGTSGELRWHFHRCRCAPSRPSDASQPAGSSAMDDPPSRPGDLPSAGLRNQATMASDKELGLELLRRGDTSAAVPYLERACQSDPSDVSAQIALGVAYSECGRADEALHRLRAATIAAPGIAGAHYNLGLALERAGRADEAVAPLRRALALQPGHERAALALQRVLSATAGRRAPLEADRPAAEGAPAPRDASAPDRGPRETPAASTAAGEPAWPS